MRSNILKILKENWNSFIFLDLTIKDFIPYIYEIYMLLDKYNIGYKDHVILYANNSITWVAIYLATMLRDATIVVLHPDSTSLEVKHVCNTTGAKLLFHDKSDNEHTFGNRMSIFMVKKIIKTYDLNNDVEPLSDLKKSDLKNLFNSKTKLYKQSLKSTCLSTITQTQGIEYHEQKLVSLTPEAIINKMFYVHNLKIRKNEFVYTTESFAVNHLLSVMAPLTKGAAILFDEDKSLATVHIMGSFAFELLWRKYIDVIFESRFWSYILNLPILYRLYNFFAKRKLSLLFDIDDLQSIVIYNNTLPYHILNVIKNHSLPFISVYGSQELSQFAAFNNYSTDSLRKTHNVGIPVIENLTFSHGELCVNDISNFELYYGDYLYTIDKIKQDYFHTGDFGYMEHNYLYIIGRMSRRIDIGEGMYLHFDELERILKGLPLVEECVITLQDVNDRPSLVVIIRPDLKIANSLRLSMEDIKNLLNAYLIKINKKLTSFEEINSVALLWNEDFALSTQGKVLVYLFQ